MDINLKTKELPFETFLLTSHIQDFEIIENLKKQIYEDIKASSLNHKTNVEGRITELHDLIRNEWFHKFLKLIKREIKMIFQDNFIIKEAWGTISNKNEKVKLHHHNAVRGFSGILYLTEGGTGTDFPQYNLNIEEKIGKYILFHPLLLHSVQKQIKDGDRMTVAFNMVETKDWNDYRKDTTIR